MEKLKKVFPAKPRIALALVLLLFVLIVFLGLSLRSRLTGLKPAREITTPDRFLPEKTLTGLEITRQALEFVESQKQPDQTYHTVIACHQTESGSSCSSQSERTFFPGMFVWLFEELTQVTGDSSYQQRAGVEMERLLGECDKNKAACEWIFFPLFSRYQQTKDQKYLRPMLEAAPKLLATQSPNVNGFSLQVMKLVMLYLSTADKRYLDEAVKRYEQAEAISENDPVNTVSYQTGFLNPVRRYDCQRYWGVEFQLFQATGDEKYLNETRSFFDHARVGEHAQDFGNISSLVTCTDALLTLAELTGDAKYKEEAQKLISYTVKNFWDSSHSPKFNSDYGFLALPFTEEKNKTLNMKYFTEHIWVMRMLLRFPKLEFEI